MIWEQLQNSPAARKLRASLGCVAPPFRPPRRPCPSLPGDRLWLKGQMSTGTETRGQLLWGLLLNIPQSQGLPLTLGITQFPETG